jgi:hypothetical protein
MRYFLFTIFTMDKRTSISFAKVLEMMKTEKCMTFYEYYDGLHVNYEYLVEGDGGDLCDFQDKILKLLPDTRIECFEYGSRFPSETEFSRLKAIPDTLMSLRLVNCVGISKQLKREIKEKGIEFVVDDN